MRTRTCLRPGYRGRGVEVYRWMQPWSRRTFLKLVDRFWAAKLIVGGWTPEELEAGARPWTANQVRRARTFLATRLARALAGNPTVCPADTQ